MSLLQRLPSPLLCWPLGVAMCLLDLKSKNTVSVLSRLRLTDEKCLIPSLQMLPGWLGKFIFTPQHLAPDRLLFVLFVKGTCGVNRLL